MEVPATLFFIVFFSVVAYMVFRAVKYGGLRGAMYGGRVVATFGDVEVERTGTMKSVMRVLVLDDGRIVLEQSSRALLAASMSGIPMNPANADQLIQFLQLARATPML